MPYKFNFHSHNHFCDGSTSPEEMVRAAIRLGMPSLGISSHGPVPYPNSWCMDETDLKKYLQEISRLKEKYAGRIEIHCGLEADYVERKSNFNDFRNGSGIDYIIGSVHYLYENPDDKPFSVDGTRKEFLQGFRDVYRKDAERMTRRFFSLNRQMIEEQKPDLVGHIDKIRINLSHVHPAPESEKWYQEELHQTIGCLVANDQIIEVNTRGIYKKYTTEPYPSYGFLRELKNRNGRISLNSDAHHPDELLGHYTETILILKAIGFTESWVLLRDTWQPVPIG
jgi:histidinol-phosphatase (PHP family)